MAGGVESMFGFICVNRIGLNGVPIFFVCYVVLCVVTSVSVHIIPTSMFRVSCRRSNIEFATHGIKIHFPHVTSLLGALYYP